MKPSKVLLRLHAASCGAVAIAVASLSVSIAQAATADKADLSQLNAMAKEHGFVPVLVNVGNVSLQSIKSGGAAYFRAQMQMKQDALLAEIGSSALQGGTWNNGLGQIGVYVTAAGLQKLQSSSIAISFAPDATRGMRLTASDRDGALSAIEDALRVSSTVNVEVVYDIPSVSYDIDTSGRTVASATAAFETEALVQVKRSFDRHHELAVANNVETIRAQLLGRYGALGRNLSMLGAVAVSMKVDRSAFLSQPPE